MPQQTNRYLPDARKLVWAAVTFGVLAVASSLLIFSLIPENICSSDTLAYWLLLPFILGLTGTLLAFSITVTELRRKQNKKAALSLLLVIGCILVSGSNLFGVGLPFALCGIGGN